MFSELLVGAVEPVEILLEVGLFPGMFLHGEMHDVACEFAHDRMLGAMMYEIVRRGNVLKIYIPRKVRKPGLTVLRKRIE